MKKILHKIWQFFQYPFIIFMAILFCLCLVLRLPFDYIKYKRSPYWKDLHKKYRMFAASGDNFELYNQIALNDLPIEYIANPQNDTIDCGWFVFEKTLIVTNYFDFAYDFELGKWCYHSEDDDEQSVIMTIEEYIEAEIEDVNKIAGDMICNDAVILVDAASIENPELAKEDGRFLVYDNNRVDVLRTFCGKRTS
ncbi:MAG: hypothetical protein IJA62_00970 [Ruminococcus sp.]|nr:hypothetical protein [Ruminococcus sp.]